ncbi:Gfo/Idh/MocA family protein [Kitasatospora kifunensis]|uniref:Putative dehydrogenase n=1 Tax=Kitasatospora kifunensis TaxID=58351 RepID=A0A7W7RBP7_KITKI|nr:Gfo/Idh/MocA family oxidoreductase [Kitasatospora kifunensis]MBB4929065.1 putative dehydrogenase [Kitasatospora kifunensis]
MGAGEVGAKHLQALRTTPGLQVAAVADPHPKLTLERGLPLFAGWRAGLRVVQPQLVVVAAPPSVALAAARDAAAAGATVLVEKPVTLDAAELDDLSGDERIFVGFQPHFAPGLPRLLQDPPRIQHAQVVLTCRRDRSYYRGWRARHATAGGILHQQAIHGLSLALRLMPGEVTGTSARTEHRRAFADTEDRICARLDLSGGRTITVDARVDDDGPALHHVVLQQLDGRTLAVRGRNLEAGLGEVAAAPDHQQLRRDLYAALADVARGGPAHPSLFPLTALRRHLEVINDVYAHAERFLAPGAAAA